MQKQNQKSELVVQFNLWIPIVTTLNSKCRMRVEQQYARVSRNKLKFFKILTVFEEMLRNWNQTLFIWKFGTTETDWFFAKAKLMRYGMKPRKSPWKALWMLTTLFTVCSHWEYWSCSGRLMVEVKWITAGTLINLSAKLWPRDKTLLLQRPSVR